MAAISDRLMPNFDEAFPPRTREVSAVSWAAVFAGAIAATALSMIMFLLGTGIGLTMISPWGDRGMSATAAGISTVVWITFVQIVASILGGYLAGRLRSRWLTVHTHEVYFRDTAHGLLAWSLATLLMATLFSSAVGTAVSTGVEAGAAVAGEATSAASSALGGSAAGLVGASRTGGAANGAGAQGMAQQGQEGMDQLGYFVDTLFRPAPNSSPSGADNGPASRPSNAAEVARIFANALKTGTLPAADSAYLAQMVSMMTGLSQAEAQMRVNDTFTQFKQTVQQAKTEAQQAADTARKASAYTALLLVVALLVGAFVASWAATFGGRLRDSSALNDSAASTVR
jgi:hypothetical protein